MDSVALVGVMGGLLFKKQTKNIFIFLTKQSHNAMSHCLFTE